MNKKVKKELREFGIIAIVFAILYFTGLHTEVLGFAQRMVLATGVMNSPSDELAEKELANYDFTLINADGESIDFNKYRNKVVFINLWATWCGPCIAEMPGIESLYQDFEEHDQIEFVMISLDQDFEKAKKFKERKEFSFPIYGPVNRALPDIYRSGSIPTTFVISKDGVIVQKKVGMANYDTRKFRKFLNKLAAKS